MAIHIYKTGKIWDPPAGYNTPPPRPVALVVSTATWLYLKLIVFSAFIIYFAYQIINGTFEIVASPLLLYAIADVRANLMKLTFEKQLVSEGLITRGQVAERKKEHSIQFGDNQQAYTIAWTLGDKALSIEQQLNASEGVPEVGDEVPVLYLPKNPRAAIVILNVRRQALYEPIGQR